MSDEEIDLKDIIMLFWKKKIFIFIVVCISIILGCIFTFLIKKQTYTSEALIMFGRVENYEPQEGESQLLSEIQFNSSIINNYKNFIISNEVLEQVISNLELDITIGELKENLKVESDGASIQLDFSFEDSELSIKIVNEILKVFVDKSREFYQIKHTYTISNADESTTESDSSHIMDVCLCVIIGVVISCGGVLVEYLFNPRINNENDIENKLELKLISSLNLISDQKGQVIESIENSEQFKVLRANIEFSTKKTNKNKTYFITSSNQNDGKTFVAVNLAIAFSEIGKKVLVIDTDKKDGSLDKVLQIKNEYGLSNYLVDSNKISETNKGTENYLIQDTKFENLSAVTIGTIKGKKFEIIQNNKFIKFIEEMKENFDIIILDGAEMIQYADSRFLSNISDQTILIASMNKTKEKDLLNAKKEIEKVDGNLLGIVLNYIKRV